MRSTFAQSVLSTSQQCDTHTHWCPQRVTARGGPRLSFLLLRSGSPGRLSSHVFAVPNPAKCIGIICPQDGGDGEGFA